MIIHSLVGYYDALNQRGEIPREGWCKERVSYALSITEDGELFQLIPTLRDEERRGKLYPVPQKMLLPAREVTTSGIKANFLCENSSYFLGIDEKGKPERSIRCYEACKELHVSLLSGVDSLAARSILAFFATWNPREARGHPALQPFLDKLTTANFVFYMDGHFAHEDEDIIKAWDDAYFHDDNEGEILCLVTGERAPYKRVHGKIMLPGGQTFGHALISYNENAFESYAKEGNQNSPIGKYAAFAYVTALNHLIADRQHRISLGDDTVVYWSQDGSTRQQDTLICNLNPEVDEGNALDQTMKRVELGLLANDPELEKPFYVLCLSPNAARISVRFFLQSTFGDILRHCAAHYTQMEIDRPSFDPYPYLSLPRLLNEAVNQKSNDKKPSPTYAAPTLRAILTGERYPSALYTAVFVRIKADQTISRGRAGIIKAYLLRNTEFTEKEGASVSLNENATNHAYVMGRLFAVLEHLQQTANPGISATIKDRYFTSACSTPGSVFPTLIKLANHHLAKLDAPGLITYFNKEIGQLMDKLTLAEGAVPSAFPAQMGLNEQGLFTLGYYHQVQHRYRKKEEE